MIWILEGSNLALVTAALLGTVCIGLQFCLRGLTKAWLINTIFPILFITYFLLIILDGYSYEIIELILFVFFSSLAIIGAILLIAQQNPARAAIAFTLVVVNVSGLFLLLGAPYIMATTIIVYAGAIIVTFLFVLMLAQQERLSIADRRVKFPVSNTVAAFIVFTLICIVINISYASDQTSSSMQTIQRIVASRDRALLDELLNEELLQKLNEAVERSIARCYGRSETDASTRISSPGLDSLTRMKTILAKVSTSYDNYKKHASDQTEQELRIYLQQLVSLQPSRLSLSRGLISPYYRSFTINPDPELTLVEPPKLPAQNVSAIARTLYTDYLLVIEIVGMLLLVATIGAVVIAQRRPEQQ